MFTSFFILSIYYSGDILWYEMCESTPTNSEESVKYFGDIANALQTLHSQTNEWSEDDIISVVDELTSRCHKMLYSCNTRSKYGRRNN